MNNRQKMRIATTEAKKWMIEKGYTDIHLFPHTRWSKDVHFRGLSFDGCATNGIHLVLFQVKTNCAPSTKTIELMKQISEESSIRILWFNKVSGKGGVTYYGSE